jgi:hypothetical protein
MIAERSVPGSSAHSFFRLRQQPRLYAFSGNVGQLGELAFTREPLKTTANVDSMFRRCRCSFQVAQIRFDVFGHGSLLPTHGFVFPTRQHSGAYPVGLSLKLCEAFLCSRLVAASGRDFDNQVVAVTVFRSVGLRLGNDSR